MEITTYINDHPYRILDTGEGACHLIVINTMNNEPLADFKLMSSLANERVVIIDLSLAWHRPFGDESTSKLSEICADIHLLVDIYWLEEVRITIQQGGETLYHLLKASLMKRLVE